MLPEVKLATGVFLVSNHALPATSSSASALPVSMLARSISMRALPVSGLAGSTEICAANFLKLPSTGTFICLETKVMLLCCGRSTADSAPAAGDAAKSRTLGEIEQGIARVRGRGDLHQASALERWLREVET